MSSSSPSPLRLPAKKSEPEKRSGRGAAFGSGGQGGETKPHAVPPAQWRDETASPATSRSRLSEPKRLVSAEPPNLLLDPFGVAGTGTARRLRTAKLRRQWQLLLGSVALVAILGAAASFLIRRELPNIGATPTQEVPFVQSAPATVVGEVAYVPALDGSLWRVTSKAGEAQKLRGAHSIFPARVPPLVVRNRAFLASLDGTLTAFDTGANRTLWQQKLGGALSTMPVMLKNGLLVAANDAGQVMALRAANGSRSWMTQANGPVGDALAATNEGVVVSSLPSSHGRGALECFDARSGKRRWRFPQNILDAAPGVAAPLFDAASNHVFWASDYGFVIALDATTGAKIWKTFAAPLKGATSRTVTLRGAPALWENTLIVGGNDGSVRAFDAQHGRPLWIKRMNDAVTLPARFVQCDGQNVASVSDGRQVVLLDLATGKTVRRLVLTNEFGPSWFPNSGWIQDAQNHTWRLGSN